MCRAMTFVSRIFGIHDVARPRVQVWSGVRDVAESWGKLRLYEAVVGQYTVLNDLGCGTHVDVFVGLRCRHTVCFVAVFAMLFLDMSLKHDATE